MLGGIRFISTPKNIASMNRNTPILFISGDKDPVGEMGKGVRRAYEAFRRAGVRDVELKLYKGLRHEILNEDCRAVVYNDLWSWIEKHYDKSRRRTVRRFAFLYFGATFVASRRRYRAS